MGGTVSNWSIVVSCVEGILHEHKKMGCQDRASYYMKGGRVSIALADGAGFSEHSHVGAQVVTRYVCRYMVRNFDRVLSKDDDRIRQDVSSVILRLLEATAQNAKVEIRQLASTLLCVAFNEDAFICLHVGDGVIGMLSNGRVVPVSLPYNDEFANVTCFTVSDDLEGSLRVTKGGACQEHCV